MNFKVCSSQLHSMLDTVHLQLPSDAVDALRTVNHWYLLCCYTLTARVQWRH